MDTSNVKNSVDEMTSKAKEALTPAKDEVVQSGKDWVNYIKTHPIQSILFGIIGYFAVKGITHD